jgi:hypothetical protein
MYKYKITKYRLGVFARSALVFLSPVPSHHLQRCPYPPVRLLTYINIFIYRQYDAFTVVIITVKSGLVHRSGHRPVRRTYYVYLFHVLYESCSAYRTGRARVPGKGRTAICNGTMKSKKPLASCRVNVK